MIKAVIADDSQLFRKALTELLETDGRISVIGAAADGHEAIQYVKTLTPDVLILDYQMPGIDGLETLKIIMEENPLPVLMLSALTKEGAAVTLRALELGAVDYFTKPIRHAGDIKQVSDELIQKIVAVVQTKAISYPKPIPRPVKGDLKALKDLKKRDVDIIAVGSSTGGVKAAVDILSDLPSAMKPIVWVQHMPRTFTASFAERLNQYSKLHVKEAEDGDVVQPDTCYIARAGFQMVVESKDNHRRLRLYEDLSSDNLHCPSCDVLFESVAKLYGTKAIGVILTGMGKDGTEGLLKMHEQGAFVIGQNEASSIVYGMAKAARKAGAVDLELDVCYVAEALVRLGSAQMKLNL